MFSDDILEEYLEAGKLRPVAGSLWCEKYTGAKAQLEVEGLGIVNYTDVTDSGIVLVSNTTEETDNIRAELYIVRAVGREPEKWSTRWASRGPEWEHPENVDVVYNTTFEAQKVLEGTVIATRSIAGESQGSDSRFVQIRYDEIVAIGTPVDEDSLPMLPAPGWVLVEKDEVEEELESGLYKGTGTVYDNGFVLWGTIVGIPRETPCGVEVGARVAIPLFYGAGATEYVEFENGQFRVMPEADLLAVEYEGL